MIFLENITISDGALYSLLSIVMVFAILLIIIGITTLVFKIIGLFEYKAKIDVLKSEGAIKEDKKEEVKSTEIVDDDMMAAVLVATIDYQNEIKKDVKLISVKEVK